MEDSDPLRVLVLATTFPRWKDDDIPQFVYDLSQQLDSMGFEIVVLAPHHAGAKRYECMNGLQVYRYPYFYPYKYQKLMYQGGVLPTVTSDLISALQVPLFLMSLLIHTFWVLWQEDIDVIHSHWVVPNGVLGAIVNLLFDKPHVMTLHAGGVLGLRGTKIGPMITSFVAWKTDVIAPVSTHIRDEFDTMLNSRVSNSTEYEIQPMGTHIDDYDLDKKDEIIKDKNLEGTVLGLFVGRLAEKKGVRYLLNAIDRVQGSIDDFQFAIVGKGYLQDELETYSDERNLGDVVEFTGWVSENELKRLYIAADFVVVPSIETKEGDTEGMPTVIAESFAAGNPVIGSNVGGIPDVIEEDVNGYLIEQRSPAQITERIKKLINDDETRSRLSNGARESAQQVDWHRCGEVYASLFQRALVNDDV